MLFRYKSTIPSRPPTSLKSVIHIMWPVDILLSPIPSFLLIGVNWFTQSLHDWFSQIEILEFLLIIHAFIFVKIKFLFLLFAFIRFQSKSLITVSQLGLYIFGGVYWGFGEISFKKSFYQFSRYDIFWRWTHIYFKIKIK